MLSAPKDDDQPTHQSSSGAKNCPLCKTSLSERAALWPSQAPQLCIKALCGAAAHLGDRRTTKTFLSQSWLRERAEDKSHASHAMLVVKTRSAFVQNMIHQCSPVKPAALGRRGEFGLRHLDKEIPGNYTTEPGEFASDLYQGKIWTPGTQYLARVWPKVASIWILG